MGKDSPSPPPAPDYTGAAQATAAGNLDAARLATKANRVNQYTPYGSLTYTNNQNGDQDLWRADYTLSPVGQQLLDYQNNASLGLGANTGKALDRVDSSLSQPFDYGSVQDVQDQAYRTLTSRLDPQWQAADAQNDTKLRNQGLMPGSEAYDRARAEFNNAKNDAYQQANLAAINLSPQTFQMASALRNQPLNELNALRTGSQVTNPTFQQAPQQQTTQGPNYLGAAQAQGQYDQNVYNAGIAQNNAMMGGLFQLGGAIAGSPFWGPAPIAASDRRLKSNIERLGDHPLGIGIYIYDIAGRREIGVMADEVETVIPEAVFTGDDGYKRVNYALIQLQ